MTRPGFEEQWRRRFVQRGSRFDDDAGIAGWTPSGLETRLRNFRRVWPGDRPGALWLDAGCGAGSYTRHLSACGVRPVGLDYALPSLRKARQRSPGDIPWMVGDVTRLPVAPASLDGILCLGVMQALARPEAAVAELMAAVRPGGQIWIDVLNADCLITRLQRGLARLRGRGMVLRYDRPRQLAHWLRAHGAEDVRIHWVPILPGPLRRLQPWLETPAVRRLLATVPGIGALVSHAVLVSAVKTGVQPAHGAGS
ncbi:Methyltransferase domain-containing protein [Ectothiorhodospira mobilis]|uniref:Methyltransferase domain-containing protein n=1 Tax=Ectothiorhodospira mobilis TaxID=195064 RepID=A0A1I4P7Q8_ECTMO|nr:class I SAM-dependent methyltransferase [Ectothiorhodospira mobilis]SFM23838.1 Methyltransferase domain-containing protein [Ectothiorhodospira mobilis]